MQYVAGTESLQQRTGKEVQAVTHVVRTRSVSNTQECCYFHLGNVRQHTLLSSELLDAFSCHSNHLLIAEKVQVRQLLKMGLSNGIKIWLYRQLALRLCCSEPIQKEEGIAVEW